jgi:hypothetical protein
VQKVANWAGTRETWMVGHWVRIQAALTGLSRAVPSADPWAPHWAAQKAALRVAQSVVKMVAWWAECLGSWMAGCLDYLTERMRAAMTAVSREFAWAGWMAAARAAKMVVSTEFALVELWASVRVGQMARWWAGRWVALMAARLEWTWVDSKVGVRAVWMEVSWAWCSVAQRAAVTVSLMAVHWVAEWADVKAD